MSNTDILPPDLGKRRVLGGKRARAYCGDHSESTWQRWRKAGLLPPPIHLGPRLLGWRVEDLDSMLDKMAAERTGEEAA